RVAADVRHASELADGEHGTASTVSLNPGGKTKVKGGQAAPAQPLRRTSQPGSPQDSFIDTATGATCGQLPLDDHHLAISHVVNDHLTRGASRALDDLDCFLAGRASGTEHFDLSLGSHLSTP